MYERAACFTSLLLPYFWVISLEETTSARADYCRAPTSGTSPVMQTLLDRLDELYAGAPAAAASRQMLGRLLYVVKNHYKDPPRCGWVRPHRGGIAYPHFRTSGTQEEAATLGQRSTTAMLSAAKAWIESEGEYERCGRVENPFRLDETTGRALVKILNLPPNTPITGIELLFMLFIAGNAGLTDPPSMEVLAQLVPQSQHQSSRVSGPAVSTTQSWGRPAGFASRLNRSFASRRRASRNCSSESLAMHMR